MILRSSPFSPFGRKVLIAASILGLDKQIEVTGADTLDPADPLRQQNPLGKIPILLVPARDNAPAAEVFDSRVITEYLDFVAGGGKILPNGAARFPVLRVQAMADGMMDASILRMYEKRFRPVEMHVAAWVEYQTDKVTRTLAVFEASPPRFNPAQPNVGDIALACALGYLDLRFGGEWRADHPALVAWLDAFSKAVLSYEGTRPPAA